MVPDSAEVVGSDSVLDAALADDPDVVAEPVGSDESDLDSAAAAAVASAFGVAASVGSSARRNDRRDRRFPEGMTVDPDSGAEVVAADVDSLRDRTDRSVDYIRYPVGNTPDPAEEVGAGEAPASDADCRRGSAARADRSEVPERNTPVG